MKRSTKAILILFVILIAVMAAIYVHEVTRKQYVTDPVIAHIPLRAELELLRPFPDPDDPTSINFVYTLTPQVDVKTDVSEGLILPEGIVFVENNLPTGQITLKKGRTYRYNAKIKVVKPGRWMIYASPGVYADVSGTIYGVFDATEPLIRYLHRERVSNEERDTLMNITKNWLRGYGVKYEREEVDCTIISRPASGIPYINIKCYGCEMVCFSKSILYDRYYFVIEKDLLTNETKVRNVYRWAYQTPAGWQREPVCEEITRAKM